LLGRGIPPHVDTVGLGPDSGSLGCDARIKPADFLAMNVIQICSEPPVKKKKQKSIRRNENAKDASNQTRKKEILLTKETTS
jgi:hypothetical protein